MFDIEYIDGKKVAIISSNSIEILKSLRDEYLLKKLTDPDNAMIRCQSTPLPSWCISLLYRHKIVDLIQNTNSRIVFFLNPNNTSDLNFYSMVPTEKLAEVINQLTEGNEVILSF